MKRSIPRAVVVLFLLGVARLGVAQDHINKTNGINLFFSWFAKGMSHVALQEYVDASTAFDQAFTVSLSHVFEFTDSEGNGQYDDGDHIRSKVDLSTWSVTSNLQLLEHV